MRVTSVFALLTIITVFAAGCGAEQSPTVASSTQEVSNQEAASENASADTSAEVTAFLESTGETALSDSDASVVYFTSDLTSDGLMRAYRALNVTPSGNVAVKISTGESERSNHLRPDFIADVVKSVNGAIVECNTAYGGSRSNTAYHRQVVEDRGYTAIADVDIMDEDGSMTLPVTGGRVLSEDYVGAHFANYDYFLILSHFKGHSMAGFGGAIKNISIGIASSEGKSFIHTGGKSKSGIMGDQTAFLEAMAEAGKAVSDALSNGERIAYINVMNRLSVDCDCDGNPAEPDMHDIGILSSTDPVALDQACVDLVYAASDGTSLINRIESRNGIHTIEHAEEIGLGSRTYQIVNLDETADATQNETDAPANGAEPEAVIRETVAPFHDVAAGQWFSEPIAYCYANGLMSGVSANAFDPSGTTTRAMLAQILYNTAGKPDVSSFGTSPFADVAPSTWYHNAVVWAKNAGVVSGYPDGTYGVNDPVSREQIVTMMYNDAGRPSPGEGIAFTDMSSVSAYASDAVRWGSSLGLFAGSGGFFRPAASATRAEIATFITAYHRYRTARNDAPEENNHGEDARPSSFYIKVNGTVFQAVAEDNSSAAALMEQLAEGDVTIDMHDFSNFEKVGDLPWTLPRNDERISTEPGDIILYLGNRFVIYYGTNNWELTRLAKIENTSREALLAVLGDGDVQAVLSLHDR